MGLSTNKKLSRGNAVMRMHVQGRIWRLESFLE
jgi:hypothetical protein